MKTIRITATFGYILFIAICIVICSTLNACSTEGYLMHNRYKTTYGKHENHINYHHVHINHKK